MIISLPNGKVIHRSISEFLLIDDDEIQVWYQNMVADDCGDFIENPFAKFIDIDVSEFDIPENPE